MSFATIIETSDKDILIETPLYQFKSLLDLALDLSTKGELSVEELLKLLITKYKYMPSEEDNEFVDLSAIHEYDLEQCIDLLRDEYEDDDYPGVFYLGNSYGLNYFAGMELEIQHHPISIDFPNEDLNIQGIYNFDQIWGSDNTFEDAVKKYEGNPNVRYMNLPRGIDNILEVFKGVENPEDLIFIDLEREDIAYIIPEEM